MKNCNNCKNYEQFYNAEADKTGWFCHSNNPKVVEQLKNVKIEYHDYQATIKQAESCESYEHEDYQNYLLECTEENEAWTHEEYLEEKKRHDRAEDLAEIEYMRKFNPFL